MKSFLQFIIEFLTKLAPVSAPPPIPPVKSVPPPIANPSPELQTKRLGINTAQKLIGLNENKDTQNIMGFLKQYSKNNDIAINPVETSWCAAFVNACERSVGNPGTGSLLALSFKKYGKNIIKDDVEYGDILCFVFPSDAPGHGHVTYFMHDNGDTVSCLGGNQQNEVRISEYNWKYVVAIRSYL